MSKFCLAKRQRERNVFKLKLFLWNFRLKYQGLSYLKDFTTVTVTLYWTGCLLFVMKDPHVAEFFHVWVGHASIFVCMETFGPTNRKKNRKEKRQNPIPAEEDTEEKTFRILQGCCQLDLFRRYSTFVVLFICPKRSAPRIRKHWNQRTLHLTAVSIEIWGGQVGGRSPWFW